MAASDRTPDKYEEQLNHLKNEQKESEKGKSELHQQLMKVRNMVKRTLLPVVAERSRPQPRQQLLDVLEEEKAGLRKRIHSIAQKRGHQTPPSDPPIAKKSKADNEIEQPTTSSALHGACLRHLASNNRVPPVQSPNIIDSVLTEFGRISQMMDMLKNDKGMTASTDATFLELTSSCDVTVTLLRVFCNMHSSGRDSLANTVRDAANKLKHQLGQSLESLHRQNGISIVSHYSKFTQSTLFICKLIAELNARIGKSVLMLRREENDSCDWSLRQAIVTGGDMAVDQELQGGLQEMTDAVKILEGKLEACKSEEKSTILKGVKHVATSFGILLNKCQETQFELGSVLAGEERRTSSFYLQSYERALSLVQNIRQGLWEIGEIVRLVVGSHDGEVTRSLLDHTSRLYTPASTIGLSAATLDLLHSLTCSLTSLESMSSTSSEQDYRPSDLAMLASRQVMAACRALERALRGSSRQSENEEDEVFLRDARQVQFEEPTSKDILLVTKYSYNQSFNSSSGC